MNKLGFLTGKLSITNPEKYNVIGNVFRVTCKSREITSAPVTHSFRIYYIVNIYIVK